MNTQEITVGQLDVQRHIRNELLTSAVKIAEIAVSVSVRGEELDTVQALAILPDFDRVMFANRHQEFSFGVNVSADAFGLDDSKKLTELYRKVTHTALQD